MQNRLSLKAQERTVLGKKVKGLRKQGIIPAHVFGNKVETEHVSVNLLDFHKVYSEVGETGLVDLKIGEEKVRPVLIREVQVDPVRGQPLHIDFYQVNLKEKVTVAVPIELTGDQPELVLSGEAVVIQPLGEVEVEALPTDLPESIEVNISKLKQIGDVVLVSELQVPEGVDLQADSEAVVVKLDTAISAETQELLEEQAAEQAAAEAAAAEEAPAEGEAKEGEEKVEGEEGAEGAEGEAKAGETEEKKETPEEKPQ